MQAESEWDAICFNPNCPTPMDRAFKCPHPHANNPQCRRWIKSEIWELFYKPFQDVEVVPQITFDFASDPLGAMKDMYYLKQASWKKRLQEMFDEIVKHFKKTIEIVHDKLITEFEKNLANVPEYPSLISSLLQSRQAQQHSGWISMWMKEKENWIAAQNSFKGFSVGSLHEFLKEHATLLHRLPQYLWSPLESKKKASKLFDSHQQDKAKFDKYIAEEDDNPYSRIQTLAATFSIVPQTYLITSNSISLSCFLCKEQFQEFTDTRKKEAKKFLTMRVLKHIATNHFDAVFANYRKKVLRTVVKEVSVDELMEEIKFRGVKEVEIIDRENAGNYEPKSEMFHFQVVNKRNSNLARGMFISAQSTMKDAADIMISFICKELFTIAGMKIVLVTKDHFGQTMQGLCRQLGYQLEIASGKLN